MAKFLKDSIGEIKEVHALINNEFIIEDVSIREINAEEVLLAVRGDRFGLDGGDEIGVELYCSNGVFAFTATVKKCEINFPYTFVYLKAPLSFEVQQEREFFRTKFDIKAQLAILFHNGQRKIFESETFDISGNGTSLLISPVLNNSGFEEALLREDINKYAKIGICLRFENREINTFVEFVHRRKLSENSQLQIYAFKFTNLSPGDCDYITKQCFARQLAEQHKSKIQ